MKLDLIFSGVGGQGVVVLSDIFCEAALIDGFDVAKAEIHGMAQRGGSITAHVRIGDKVLSPLVERGTADIIVGFEILETARAMSMLRKGGSVIVNMKYIPPTTMCRTTTKPLKIEKLLRLIRDKARRVDEIDGIGLASELGTPLVVNTILLGALSALSENPVRTESLEKAIAARFNEKYVTVNLKAFQLGREHVIIG